MGTFLEDRLPRNNDNSSGFPSEPFRSTPSVPAPPFLQAPSPVLRGTRRRSRSVSRGFPLSARTSKSSVNPKNTHACTISQSINNTMIRLLAAVLSPNNPFLHSLQTDWGIQTLVLPNRKRITLIFPGPDLATDTNTPGTRSVLGGPSPQR